MCHYIQFVLSARALSQVDFKEEREGRDKIEREEKKKIFKQLEDERKAEEKRRKEEAEQR